MWCKKWKVRYLKASFQHHTVLHHAVHFSFDDKLLQWFCHSVIRDCVYTVLPLTLFFPHEPKLHLNKYLLYICAQLLNSGDKYSFCCINDQKLLN